MGACSGRGHQSDPSWEVHKAGQQSSITASIAMNLEHLGLVGSREGRNGGQGSPHPYLSLQPGAEGAGSLKLLGFGEERTTS